MDPQAGADQIRLSDQAGADQVGSGRVTHPPCCRRLRCRLSAPDPASAPAVPRPPAPATHSSPADRRYSLPTAATAHSGSLQTPLHELIDRCVPAIFLIYEWQKQQLNLCTNTQTDLFDKTYSICRTQTILCHRVADYGLKTRHFSTLIKHRSHYYVLLCRYPAVERNHVNMWVIGAQIEAARCA